MGNEKKKWYQKGEFEDGYQFGDIFRTVKNSISGKDEEVEKVKNITEKSGTSAQIPFAAVKDGRLDFDLDAQMYGFANSKERKEYIEQNPELYVSMGGYKYVPAGTPLRSTESITNSNKAIERIVERFKNTDSNKVQEAINAVGSGQWLDKNTIKKHKNTINSYVNDYISLERLGCFDSLSKEERKNNVEILRSIKKDVENKNTLYTTFDSIYDYNAYIMNNTAERENGMSMESIAARNKAYNENTLRMKEIEDILDKTGSSKVVTEDGLKGWLMKFTADYDIGNDGVNTKELIDEYEFLKEQNILYERFNKENDRLVIEFANSNDFATNLCFYFIVL